MNIRTSFDRHYAIFMTLLLSLALLLTVSIGLSDAEGATDLVNLDEQRQPLANTITGDSLPKLNSRAVIVAEKGDSNETDQWPLEKTNGDLPMAGVFYGNGLAGRGAANSPAAIVSSRRFRSERSGEVVSYTYHNRVLRDSEIHSRCDAYGESSVWCKCKNAGLDANLCGYALPNSYHLGNGGTIVVELRPDDGNGYPSETVLGKTYPFIPTENRDQWFATLDFELPAPIEKGGIYHLVHTNLTPPTQCPMGNVPYDQARLCSRHEGAQGLNGSFYASTSSTTGHWGPVRGDSGAATLYKRYPGSEWKQAAHSVSYYEIGYLDGVSVGDSYHAIDALGTTKVVGGSNRVRQKFTVRDQSPLVDGVWLVYGHRSFADGSALRVELKDEQGIVLAHGSIEASLYCLEEVSIGAGLPGRDCKDWGYTDLNTNVSLLEGQTYTLELSGSATVGFAISTYQPLSFGMKDRNQWTEAYAQISTDDGAGWGRWAEKSANERDMGLLFTIEGMPKQLR